MGTPNPNSWNAYAQQPGLAQVGDVLLGDDRWIRAESDSMGNLSVGLHPNIGHQTSDRTRVGAQYVVEDARMTGGGSGMGDHDIFPDGHHITARRLRPDGTYDPQAEVVHFYQSGSFNCMIVDPKIVGKMRVIVTPTTFV